MRDIDGNVSFYVMRTLYLTLNFNWIETLLGSLEYCIFVKLDMDSFGQFGPLDLH